MTGYALPGFVHVRQVRTDLVGQRVVARSRITRRFVSITYLSQGFLSDVEFRIRFAAEAGRLARLRDARVVRLRQFVVSGDHAAVVADHVDGTPLRALLIEEGAIAVEAALVVFKDVLRGLAASHATGVAHSDLKPENVFLTHSGRVRLVDFGLSTCDSRRLLASSTPFYLAPEQWSGGPATPAGDLYAATATFFECLAGAPPFHAENPAALSVLHEYSDPPLDAVPGPVRQLVASGLAKDPESRPSARSFLIQIEKVASHVLGRDWERHGRRELTSLLTSSSYLPSRSVLAGLSDPADRTQRPPVRLTAALGGALVMAAGLSSQLPGSPPTGGSALPGGPPLGAAPTSPSPDGSEEGPTSTESPVPAQEPGPQAVAMTEPVGSSAAQPETMVAATPLSGSAPHQAASAPESVSATQPETPVQAPSTPATGSAPASGEPVPAQPMSAPPSHPGTVPGSDHPDQCAEAPEAVVVQEPLSETGFPWTQEEPWNEESMELTPSIPEWSTGHEEYDGSPFGDMGW
ncbi:MAG: protein kinase domain-containing protein [Pseudonocardiaceae bacterium]